MTTAVNDRPARPTRFRAVALVAIASLSCTTVRVPATGLPSTVKIHGDAAEPQVELWVESGGDVSPEEAAKALGVSEADVVGVDDGATQRGEQTADGGFSAADVAGETDEKHASKVGSASVGGKTNVRLHAGPKHA